VPTTTTRLASENASSIAALFPGVSAISRHRSDPSERGKLRPPKSNTVIWDFIGDTLR
jgi:hypothetical protein